MDYSQLFTDKHSEKLLAPIADLVTAVRAQDIRVWCLPEFNQSHIEITGSASSCAALASDKIPDRTIVINFAQVANYSVVCDLPVDKVLEVVLTHELGHITLCDNFGIEQGQSEFDTWQVVERLGILSPADFANLRDYAVHKKQPTFDHRRSFDNSPEWLRTFNRLSRTIGYGLAWGAIQNDIKALGLQSWDILAALQDAGWDFDISYPLSEGEDIPHALTKLAIQRNDVTELERVARAAMPQHTSRRSKTNSNSQSAPHRHYPQTAH
jgi:hypothetical protein